MYIYGHVNKKLYNHPYNLEKEISSFTEVYKTVEVNIVTGYRLNGLRIYSRWGARFSVPVQTGPGAHPASCTMGTGSFPGVESSQGVRLTPHPLLVPRSKNGVELHLYSP
jgi:hypothetical protein